jgi:hypothetical protein
MCVGDEGESSAAGDGDAAGQGESEYIQARHMLANHWRRGELVPEIPRRSRVETLVHSALGRLMQSAAPMLSWG